MKNVTVQGVQDQETGHDADLGDKVAILLFHGMGQPVQFETLDGVTSALLAVESHMIIFPCAAGRYFERVS